MSGLVISLNQGQGVSQEPFDTWDKVLKAKNAWYNRLFFFSLKQVHVHEVWRFKDTRMPRLECTPNVPKKINTQSQGVFFLAKTMLNSLVQSKNLMP